MTRKSYLFLLVSVLAIVSNARETSAGEWKERNLRVSSAAHDKAPVHSSTPEEGDSNQKSKKKMTLSPTAALDTFTMAAPTFLPVAAPTSLPVAAPTSLPVAAPTSLPVVALAGIPTATPSKPVPTLQPTLTHAPLNFNQDFQAGIIYGGGMIYTNVTYIYNLYYGDWSGTYPQR